MAAPLTGTTNVYGSRLVESDPERVALKLEQMKQAAYVLDRVRRTAVLGALREVCSHNRWILWAAHVRTNHVHVLVEADTRPEKIMHALKAYASRNLNRLGIDAPGRRRWARHGSTRCLWKDEDVRKVIRHVAEEQGDTMEVHRKEWL